MVKTKVHYVCTECGAQSNKWVGRCPQCQAWSTLTEEVTTRRNDQRSGGYAGSEPASIVTLDDVSIEQQPRISSSLAELDRVLGGGLVSGSVVLLGGDPGIGKSTLLLQTLCFLALDYPSLYITGEESLQQVSMRATRLQLPKQALQLLTENHLERILTLLKEKKCAFVAIDSIQTMFSEQLPSAPGSVAQVRETAAQLVRFAKQTQTTLFIIGHVTKEGTLAGPRVLEHMVDTVLYFEGQSDNRFRVIRAIKNRFGAVNELGIFAMTQSGLKEVHNPSAIFLNRVQGEQAGSLVLVTWEGSRPLLVEVQALVDQTHLTNPRRVTVGLEHNRLAMLLAVLHRHGGVFTSDQDVFVNAVGGIKVTETAADLPLLLTVLSSLRDKTLPNDWVAFGEVGLSGEIRPVPHGYDRLKEAVKHGFKVAICPKANVPKQTIPGLTIKPVASISEAISCL